MTCSSEIRVIIFLPIGEFSRTDQLDGMLTNCGLLSFSSSTWNTRIWLFHRLTSSFITGNLLECELERNSCGLVFQNLMLWPLSWSKDNVLDQFFQPRPFHQFHRPSTQVPWFRLDLITKWIRFKENWVNEKRLCRSVANYLFHIPDWMIISLELLPSREYVSERFLSASSADRVRMGVPRLLFSGTDLR